MSAMFRIVPSEPKSQFFSIVKPVPNTEEVGPGPMAGLAKVPPPTVWAWPGLVVGVGRGVDVGLGDGGRVVDVEVGGCPLTVTVHFWFEPPLQSQSCTFVPFVVPMASTSRQRLDCTPVMVPSVLMFHCWLAPPLQVHTVTTVPLAVPLPNASRHLPPEVICPAAVVDQTWPAQSEMVVVLPSVVGAVRQRPDPTPWMRAPLRATVCGSTVADA